MGVDWSRRRRNRRDRRGGLSDRDGTMSASFSRKRRRRRFRLTTVAAPSEAWVPHHRRLFVEYSNEIWAGGHEFSQRDWAAARAAEESMSTMAEFVARERETGLRGGRVDVVRDVHVDLPARAGFVRRDVFSPIVPHLVTGTTYFGNNIQYRSYCYKYYPGSDDVVVSYSKLR